jgi:hypothetical protein
MQSALLLPVPAAEAAVGPYRALLDPSARDGVPAHITVLYPFLPGGPSPPSHWGSRAGMRVTAQQTTSTRSRA